MTDKEGRDMADEKDVPIEQQLLELKVVNARQRIALWETRAMLAGMQIKAAENEAVVFEADLKQLLMKREDMLK